MSETFNYGPRMQFDQCKDARSTNTSSGCLEYRPGMHDEGARQSDTLISTTSNGTLGAHWKKIESIPMFNGQANYPIDSTFSMLSKPSSVVSAISKYSSSDSESSPSLISMYSSGSDLTPKEFTSTETITDNVNVLPSVECSLEDLTEKTETREERQCLSLQMQGFIELTKAAERKNNALRSTLHQAKSIYKKEHRSEEKFMKLVMEYMGETIRSFDWAHQTLEKQLEDGHDQLHQRKKTFHQKGRIEMFVRKNEGLFDANTDISTVLQSNKQRVENIRKMLDFNRPAFSPLTVFEHEDPRVAEVLISVIKMIRSLPLNGPERSEMEKTIAAMEENMQFDGKLKCDTLIRHLLAIMSSWEDTNGKSAVSMSSDCWKSVQELNSTGKPVIGNSAFESSSFELSDLPIDDSNMNDLEGELLTARIKLAVNEPIKLESWPTASMLSKDSTDGLTEMMPMNQSESLLSSYSLGSSDNLNTTSSLSASSMPEDTFDLIREELNTEPSLTSVKTALSQEDVVAIMPPRSAISMENNTIHSQSAATFDFSTASVSNEEEDALHTAKESAETQTSTLLKALQKSASKCGVAISDLMTAVSSSTESLSDTQTSHSITH